MEQKRVAHFLEEDIAQNLWKDPGFWKVQKKHFHEINFTLKSPLIFIEELTTTAIRA